VVIKVTEELLGKTNAVNQMPRWRLHLSQDHWSELELPFTILDDYRRYINSLKLCMTIGARDVTGTIVMALSASGSYQAVVQHKPCLRSDNGLCKITGDLVDWLKDQTMDVLCGVLG